MDLALPTVSSVGDLLALTLLAVVAVPVVIIDVRHRRIPDVIVLPAAAMALLLRAHWGGPGWLAVLLWATVAGAMLLVPAVIRPDGMGLGDVKLAGLLGTCLGALGCVAVLLALVAGAAGGAAWALMRGTPLREATIPFGPFLIAAALVLALPVALLHSVNVDARPHHTTGTHAAIQPARVGIGRLGWHPAMGWPGAARGARHGCGAGAGRGDAAP